MHAVVPAVVAVRWYIYTFIIMVLAAQALIHSHPVLPCKECESRWGCKMLGKDCTGYTAIHIERCLAVEAEHAVIELLRESLVLAPPATQGTHVVCGWGCYRQVWVMLGARECLAIELWHSLYLE